MKLVFFLSLFTMASFAQSMIEQTTAGIKYSNSIDGEDKAILGTVKHYGNGYYIRGDAGFALTNTTTDAFGQTNLNFEGSLAAGLKLLGTDYSPIHVGVGLVGGIATEPDLVDIYGRPVTMKSNGYVGFEVPVEVEVGERTLIGASFQNNALNKITDNTARVTASVKFKINRGRSSSSRSRSY